MLYQYTNERLRNGGQAVTDQERIERRARVACNYPFEGGKHAAEPAVNVDALCQAEDCLDDRNSVLDSIKQMISQEGGVSAISYC